jgi:hypothetical protein
MPHLTGFVVLLLLVAASAAPCGDCDQNGTYPTVLDALVVAQMAVALSPPGPADPYETRICDVDGSGGLTVLDALRLAQASASLPVTLGCPARDWRQHVPPELYSSRYPDLAYDTAHHRTIIADYYGSTGRGGTMTYDGSTVEHATWWGPFYSHAVAYDQARQVIVLFGGFGGQCSPDCTWEWDGVPPTTHQQGWVDLYPATHPERLIDHQMCYDTVRQEVLLYGGSGTPGGTYEDLWAWDGVDWSLYTPAVGPPMSYHHVMAFDEARGVAVVYGGYCGGTCSTATVDETWEWDGVSWTQRFSTVTPGTAYGLGIVGAAMAYDTREEVCILFGGYCGMNCQTAETWQWDGNQWMPLFPMHRPPIRAEHTMTYDRDRGVIVMFGGLHYPPVGAAVFMGDIWEF